MSLFSKPTSKIADLLSPSLRAFSSKSPEVSLPSPALAPGNVTYRKMLGQLHIPVISAPKDQKEGVLAQELGLRCARQEEWGELANRIYDADQCRDTTQAGLAIAELLAYGARSDVVRAAEHSLLHGRPANDSQFFHGVEALESVLEDHPDCYPLALVVAHMHIDIGWAWRGAKSNEDIHPINREAFEAHFERAQTILDSFSPEAQGSPALSAARCALLPGQTNPALYLSREFERLIDLDPMNPRHMRALGNYLLPRWYGDFQALDLEARRTAARTYEDWGAGAYAWVWFDAVLVDPDGFDMIEMDYFLDGVRDILARRQDQHVANLLAAHLYQSWQIARSRYNETGQNPEIAANLRQGFEDIITHHLREVHPLIWGHAEIGFENTARIISEERLADKGRQTALKAVAMPFLKRLQEGHTVTFGPDGITQSNS